MFNFVKKLIFARQLKLEKGKIEMLGQKMLIIPAYTYVSMLRESKNPIETGKFIYHSCKHTNKDPIGFTHKVSEKFGLTGTDLIRWMADIATMAGFGEIIIKRVDEVKKTAIIHIQDSPVANMIGRHNYAVDHSIRGYMAGAAEIIFNGLKVSNEKQIIFDYLETRCVAKGDKYCEFILDSRENFKKSTNTKIRELYDMQVGDKY